MIKKFIPLIAVICVLPFLFIALTPHINIQAPAPAEQYSQGLGSVSCDIILAQATQMPENLKQEVDQWVAKNKKLLDTLLTIPVLPSTQIFTHFNSTLRKQLQDINLSKNNYIFDIQSESAPAVIKISGFPSRLSSRVSSLGLDPHTAKWHTRSDLINKATRADIPTQQHISRLASQMLLKKLDSKLIQPINTYLYHVPGRPQECDDANYMVVQEKLAGFTPFASLSEQEKINFLTQISLKDLYQAIKYANLWDMSEDNLWVHDNKIAYPDGEKPGNEGYGPNARWKVAILGHDLEKLKFNIRNWYDGGHRKLEQMLTDYAPNRVNEWIKLYQNDPEVQYQ